MFWFVLRRMPNASDQMSENVFCTFYSNFWMVGNSRKQKRNTVEWDRENKRGEKKVDPRGVKRCSTFCNDRAKMWFTEQDDSWAFELWSLCIHTDRKRTQTQQQQQHSNRQREMKTRSQLSRQLGNYRVENTNDKCDIADGLVAIIISTASSLQPQHMCNCCF